MLANCNNSRFLEISAPQCERQVFPLSVSVRFLRPLKNVIAGLIPLALLSACAAPNPIGVPPTGPDDYGSLFYVAAGAGTSLLEPAVEGAADVILEEDRGVVGSVAIGVDTSQRTSLELQIADLGDAELNTGARIGYQTGAVTFSGRLLRKRSGLNLFAKIGVGTLLSKDSDLPGVNVVTDNNFNLVTGVGVEYLSRQGSGVRFEYVGYDTDAQFASVNFVYHFGGQTRSGRRADPLLVASDPLPETTAVAEEVDLAPKPGSRSVVVARPESEPEPLEPRPLATVTTQPTPAQQPVASQPVPLPSLVQPEPAVQPLPRATLDTPENDPANFEFEVAVTGNNAEFLEDGESDLPVLSRQPTLITPEPQLEPAPRPEPAAEPEPAPAPVLDSDADGITDDLDTCEASAAGLPVDAEGCERYNGVMNDVGFVDGEDSIAEAAKAVLNQVAVDMDDYPDLRLEMFVQAASDNREEQLLARRRTLQVFRYLRSQGVEAARLRALPPVVAAGARSPAVILRNQSNR